jgi:hypothetical protein
MYGFAANFSRLTQMSPGGISQSATNLMASTNGSGVEQWWTWGVNADNSFRITPGADNINSAYFLINSGGNLGIGGDPATWKIFAAGPALSYGWWTVSDIEYKKNLQPISDPLNKVLNMNGLSYEFQTDVYKDKKLPEGRHYGVIAQQIEQVLPEAVKVGSDGYRSVNYTEIIPVLIEAIKEQQKEIDLLKQKLDMK